LLERAVAGRESAEARTAALQAHLDRALNLLEAATGKLEGAKGPSGDQASLARSIELLERAVTAAETAKDEAARRDEATHRALTDEVRRRGELLDKSLHLLEAATAAKPVPAGESLMARLMRRFGR
jgi:hypothetical protein